MATSKRASALAAAVFKTTAATAGELAPGNIKSATRIGEDLVVVKLRRQRAAPASEAITVKIGTPQAKLRMISQRELDQALGAAVGHRSASARARCD